MLKLAIVALVVLAAGCSKEPARVVAPAGSGHGEVRVTAGLSKPASLRRSAKTAWNRLVVEVSAADMDARRDTVVLADTALLCTRLLRDVPSGPGRNVSAWSYNTANGQVVHRGGPVVLTVPEGGTAYAALTLRPLMGSIYFSFFDIDTSKVDTVYCQFALAVETLSVKAVPGTGNKVSAALDYVPDASSGVIRVLGVHYGAGTDTTFKWERAYVFYSNSDSVFTAQFRDAPGEVGVDMAVLPPGVTIVQGAMNDTCRVDSVQYGPLYVSEIHYSVDDSEYIELASTVPRDTTMDTVVLDLWGTVRKLLNVTVPAHGFYVVGKKALPFSDTTLAFMDLSDMGKIIHVRDKRLRLMDRMIYPGTTNVQGWLKLPTGSRASIVLDSLGGPLYNDFGKNWVSATSSIPGTGLLGTPGNSGR